MTGSTFTISNLGMFGIESFTAIINPPGSAILAVGKIVDTVVGAGGAFVTRPMMNLTLSADRRIVDGVVGARFLAAVKAALENPCVLIYWPPLQREFRRSAMSEGIGAIGVAAMGMPVVKRS